MYTNEEREGYPLGAPSQWAGCRNDPSHAQAVPCRNQRWKQAECASADFLELRMHDYIERMCAPVMGPKRLMRY